MAKKRVSSGYDVKSRIFATIAVITGMAGIFLLSPNITGNAVSNLTAKTSSLFGVGLLLIGIINAYFYFRNRQ